MTGTGPIPGPSCPLVSPMQRPGMPTACRRPITALGQLICQSPLRNRQPAAGGAIGVGLNGASRVATPLVVTSCRLSQASQRANAWIPARLLQRRLNRHGNICQPRRAGPNPGRVASEARIQPRDRTGPREHGHRTRATAGDSPALPGTRTPLARSRSGPTTGPSTGCTTAWSASPDRMSSRRTSRSTTVRQPRRPGSASSPPPGPTCCSATSPTADHMSGPTRRSFRSVPSPIQAIDRTGTRRSRSSQPAVAQVASAMPATTRRQTSASARARCPPGATPKAAAA